MVWLFGVQAMLMRVW
uniref:Copper-transporting ATPase RAN1 isoform X2 n=1 Tax=Rhizophora mucronata TaxID=61149 RepID=A0A2P2J170_RHIMU